MYAYVQKINEKKLPTAETANVYIKSKNNTKQARDFYLPIAQMITYTPQWKIWRNFTTFELSFFFK